MRLVKEINNNGKLTVKMLNEYFKPSDEPQMPIIGTG